MTEKKTKLAVQVEFKEDTSYHTNLRTSCKVLVWYDDRREWGYPHSYSDERGYDGLEMYNVTFHDGSQPDPNATIAYRELYSVELNDAERMVKTLRTLRSKRARMTEAEGYPTTFGQVVNRFARMIGASCVLIERTKDGQEQTGERFAEFQPGNAVSAVDRRINDWLAAQQKAEMTGAL